MSKTALAWTLVYVTGVTLSFKDPVFGFLTYIFEYYQHPPLRWWGKELPNLRWSLITSIVFLIAYMKKGDRPFLKNTLKFHQTKCLLGLLIVATIATPFAVSKDLSAGNVVDLAKLTVLNFLIAGTVRSRDHFRWVVIVMIFGSFLWGLDAYLKPTRIAGRLYSVGGPDSYTDNAGASHLITILPFLGVYFVTQRHWIKGLCIVAAPFILNTIVLCNSRGAILGVGMALIAGLIFSKGKYRFLVAGLAVLAGVLSFRLIDRNFMERQITTIDYQEEGSAMGRIQTWKGALKLIRDHPLGAGGGGFETLSPVYIPEIVEAHEGQTRSVHSTYLLVATDWGIPGFICFMGFISFTVIELHKIRKKTTNKGIYLDAMALEMSLVGFLTAAVFINRLYAEILYWLVALTISLENIRKREEEGIASSITEREIIPKEPRQASEEAR